MAKGGWVYITANRYRGGMYVGVSADVIRRVYQHREGTGSTHVRDFGKTRLVYVEFHADIEAAIAREKLLKKWRREWKFALIEADNPAWLDLWDQWFAGGGEEKNPAPCQARGDGGF
ncbi:GIY-YIG nuclease family protein [Sphingomonas sp. CCH10-B3]|uniref:GIY-YIG nuclease family protein n=1 Tax=Sphingomonas sp. CCH10-B3 TaxID=1768757 RepID=UPI0009E681DE|nr:GIY-YIG nuclease family protein [Sphingomonas sp. CCH10-B3]